MNWSLAALLFIFVAPAHADIIHKLSHSTQLTVDAAASVATRQGSTYSVSGSNIKVGTGNSDVFGGLTAGSASAAATLRPHSTYEINTAGQAFSFSESYTQGDAINAINSGSTVTSGVVPSLPAYGSVTTYSGGVAGNLAGSITSAAGGTVSLTSGGAGTTAIGQYTSELSVLQ